MFISPKGNFPAYKILFQHLFKKILKYPIQSLPPRFCAVQTGQGAKPLAGGLGTASPRSSKPLKIHLRILRVFLNKNLPRLHSIAHEHAENLIRQHSVVDRDLFQYPVLHSHRRIP